MTLLASAGMLLAALLCFADTTNNLPGWLPGVQGKPTQTDAQILVLAHRIEALQDGQKELYREVRELRERLNASTGRPKDPDPMQSR